MVPSDFKYKGRVPILSGEVVLVTKSLNKDVVLYVSFTTVNLVLRGNSDIIKSRRTSKYDTMVTDTK